MTCFVFASTLLPGPIAVNGDILLCVSRYGGSAKQRMSRYRGSLLSYTQLQHLLHKGWTSALQFSKSENHSQRILAYEPAEPRVIIAQALCSFTA